MNISLQTVLFIHFFQTLQSYTFKNKRSSYLLYEQWNAETVGVLKFKFKTFNPYGLLLYSDNSKTSNSVQSYITIKLSYGSIDCTIQMGAEDYKSKRSQTVGKNLNDLRWHTVEIQRRNRDTKLILDSTLEIIFINDGEHKILDLNSGLHFGGISPHLSRSLIDKTITSMPRFIGCIENILYKTGISSLNNEPSTKTYIPEVKNNGQSSQNQNVAKVIASVDVEPGCLNACTNFTCPNQGKCLNYFTRAKCDCVGTGYHGANCTEESDSIEFKGKEYVGVSLGGPRKSTSTNKIVLRFKTRESDGILMSAWSGNDHLMLEIHQTTIRFSMNLGGGYHIMKITNIVFSDGVWHLIEINRNGRDIYLIVDEKYSLNRSTDGVFSQFDLREELLYIGGHPKVKSLSKINSKSQTNFIGCLQQLYYNELDVVYKVLYTKSNRFNIVGAVKKGCSVVKRKSKGNRDLPSNVSKSGPDVNGGTNTEEDTPTTSPKSKKREKIYSNDASLSKKSVIWIAVGLVLGFIVLMITLILIVHNLRNRYSGVFLSSAFQKQNNNKAKKPLNTSIHNGSSNNGHILYAKKYSHITIEPHLV